MTTADVWQVLTAPSPTKKIRWFARSDRRGNLGGMVTTPEEMVNIARLSSQGYNLYVTLNPTNDRICQRISTEDVTHWAFVLIDLDPLSDNFRPNPAACAEHMRTVLRKIDSRLAFPAVVWSGRGVQMWLRFAPLPVRDIASRNDATRLTRGFLKHLQPQAPLGWKLDLVGDLARVARMPGSINHRTGQTAQMLDPGVSMSVEEVRCLLEPFKELYPEPTLSSWSGGERMLDYEDVLDDITLRAKTYLALGAISGNRHETCHHTCRTLYEHGVSKASAYSALKIGNAASTPKLEKRELEQILKQVYDTVSP